MACNGERNVLIIRFPCISNLMFFKEGKVDVSNMDTVLDNMEIRLTDDELKDLMETLPVDGEPVIELLCLLLCLH